MPHYSRICPICMNRFYAERIGKMYCGKKCANKARSFPAKLLQGLMEKAQMGLQIIPTVPKAVREFIKNNADVVFDSGRVSGVGNSSSNGGTTAIIEGLGISIAEQKELVATALKIKQDRRKQELEREFAEDNKKNDKTVNNGLIDPEMENFKL